MGHPIAERGRSHLAAALAREMEHCEVTDWPDDDGQPTRIYFRPLTGAEQQKIDSYDNEVSRSCAVLLTRARDESGALIWAGESVQGLLNDFDYDVIRAIAFLITMGSGLGELTPGTLEKE